MLSCDLDDPRGYGRVLRDAHGRVAEIREDRDLEPEARMREKEVNAGVYAMSAATLRAGIATLGTNNAQGEYYLTDVVAYGARTARVVAIKGSPDALVGVNDRVQLAEAEELLVRRIADRHRLAGVTVRAGARIDDTVEIGQDARIEAGVELRGKTSVGAGATVDAGCIVTDCSIGESAMVLPYSVMNESAVGARTQIGPFARLRAGSVIEDEAHVGNFVETKKTRLRRGAKANHLSYLGDGDIGEGANIGAGTIFCNYDGFTKQKTVIGEGAFVGSDSQLVAPVTVGKGAYVATGTTVTRDVPDDALALSRVKQENKEGYASRLKGRLAAKKGKT
jgi:bifunctional UDP-N-acetylglucosamine pyrophosphorylase/glucosamine-1-phosphate N-acetyltransferase